jgi:hypothetical protein
MRRLTSAAVRGIALLAVACCFATQDSASAIEMFTYFGDGSRIGLPSLEVPIEAYRGIPLRSDRIRARAMQAGRRQPGGITIRRDPTLQAMPQPTPRQVPQPMPEPR